MKKIILSAIALALCVTLFAQEFPVQWKSKFSFKPERWFYDDDGNYVLGRTDDQAEMLDGKTGKPIWKLVFKNDFKLKSLQRAAYNTDEGIVLFYNTDDKKKNGEKIVVDMATGKELWHGDVYAGVDAFDHYHFAYSFNSLTFKGKMIVFSNATKKFTGLDVHTGKVMWESKAYDADIKNVGIRSTDTEYADVYIFDEKDETKIQTFYINIASGEVLADETLAGSKDQKQYSGGFVRISKKVDNTKIVLKGTQRKVGFGIKFELTASGDVNWKKDFESKAIHKLWDDAPYVNMDVQGNKILVMGKEIVVFDLKTGNELWRAPYDNCDASAGLKAKQEFGIAGWPLVVGNDVYYVDLQADNAIKKVEANTGKVIWKTEKIKSNDRVPNLMLVDGVLVAQFGGMINTQSFIPNSNGGGTYKNQNRFDGNFEVRGYDPANGKLLWTTSDLVAKLGDKFKDRISTIYPINNKVVVASGENVFALEPKTGAQVFKTPLASAKVGNVFEVVVADDYETLNVFCDNGIASVNGKTGKLNYATKTDEIFWKLPGTSSYRFDQGKNTFIWVGEKDFIGFDLAQGSVKGKMKDNTNPQLTADGNTIFVRDSDKVTRYTVNK